VLDAKARVAAGDVIDIRLDPPESVETLAEDIPLAVVYEDADLIVIGTHGRRGFERMVMGSVAENLVRIATTSLFLVRRKAA
jgi:nucleotide-binding universal stress UspA family protein